MAIFNIKDEPNPKPIGKRIAEFLAKEFESLFPDVKDEVQKKPSDRKLSSRYFEHEWESMVPRTTPRQDKRNLDDVLAEINQHLYIEKLEKRDEVIIRIIGNIVELRKKRKRWSYPTVNMQTKIGETAAYKNIAVAFAHFSKTHPELIAFVKVMMEYADLDTLRYMLIQIFCVKPEFMQYNPAALVELTKIMPELLQLCIIDDDEISIIDKKQKQFFDIINVIISEKTNPDLIKFIPKISGLISKVNENQAFVLDDFLQSERAEDFVQKKVTQFQNAVNAGRQNLGKML